MLLVPAETVSGVCKLQLNPGPVTAIADTLTFTELGFVRVKFCEELLPTTTLPNEIVEGETLSVATAGETPAPCTGTEVGVALALLVIVAVPFTVPAVCGAKVTVTVRFDPAVIVTGKVRGLIEKPAPDRVTAETTKSALPVFETVTVRLLVVPTVTLPKAKLLGEALTAGLPGLGLLGPGEAAVLPHPLTRNGNTQRHATRSN